MYIILHECHLYQQHVWCQIFGTFLKSLLHFFMEMCSFIQFAFVDHNSILGIITRYSTHINVCKYGDILNVIMYEVWQLSYHRMQLSGCLV